MDAPRRRRTPAPRFIVLSLVAAVVTAACASSSKPGVGPTAALPSTSSPSTAAPSSYPLTLTDDEGTSTTLVSAPRRIVTFGPSETEIVYALGLGDRLVADCCSFDNYPVAARSVPHIEGANFQPNLEKVVALHPDVLLNTFAGGQAWEKRLRGLGVPVFFTESKDLTDLFHDIRTLGQLLGAPAPAAALTAQMSAQAAAVQQKVAGEPRVSCFFETYYGGGQLYTVGPGNFIYDLLRRAGCDPVTSGATSANPQWSREKLLAEQPAVYLVASAPGATPSAVEKRPGFDSLSSVTAGKVFVVNADLVTRNGPRTVLGLEALARALHPAAFGGG
jgi:iron complex transport system substrate-binding protein